MQYKRTILTILITMALLLALGPSGLVFADTEAPTDPIATETSDNEPTPQPEEGEEAQATPEPGEDASQQEPVEEEVALDQGAIELAAEEGGGELAQGEAQPSEEPPAEECPGESVAEVVEALAENNVVLTDEAGEAIQLATVEAEQAIDLADPWFEYGGETYRYFQAVGACAAAGYTTNCVDGTDTPIQDAIDQMNALDATGSEPITLNVEAGTFAEYFYIDRDNLTLSGPNAGVNPNTGTREEEAVLTIGMDALDWNAYGWGYFQEVFGVEGDNVIVDGFTIQGDATNGGTQEILVDAMDAQNLILRNNIFRGTSGDMDSSFGVYAYASSDATTTTIIEDNAFDNLDVANVLVSNSYGEVKNNVMTNVKVGVQTNTEYYDNTSNSDKIEIANNIIHAGRYGIWHNAMGPNGDETAYIHDNTIYGLPPDTNPSYGIYITSMAGSSTVLVEDNTVDGTDFGIGVWNAALGSTTLRGNVLKNNKVGVILDNDSYPTERGMSPSGRPGDVTIFGGKIINSSEYGFVVRDNPLNTSAGALTINASGVMLIDVTCIAHTDGEEAFINISDSTFQDCGDCEQEEWVGTNNQYTSAPTTGGGITFAPSGFIPVTGAGMYMLVDPVSDLILAEGDSISYTNLGGYWANLAYLLKEDLPASLPEGYVFVTGMTSTLNDPNGDPVSQLPDNAQITVSFFERAKEDAQEFVILYWNIETETWVELEITLENGLIQFNGIDLPGGIFVLAVK